MLNILGYKFIYVKDKSSIEVYELGRKKRWTETGKGQKGSVFVSSRGEVVQAKRVSRTFGGLQLWELTYIPLKGRKRVKKVYLKK